MTEAGDLIGRALLPLRDQDMNFFTPDMMMQALNEAQNDLAARELLFIESATGTITSGDFTITDQRYLRLREVEGVVWIDETVWNQYASNDYTDEERPYARVLGKTVSILPVPADTTTYPYTYYRVPAPISTTGAEIEFDFIHETRLINYLRYSACTMGGDPEAAGNYYALYAEGLHSPDRAFRQPRQGPWTMPRSLNRFDADPDAIHM